MIDVLQHHHPSLCLQYNLIFFDFFPHSSYFMLSIQAEEKARVGVRLLGHLLGGASVRGGVQMEIIEIPLSERPVAVACCSIRGDLLVACENTLVLFTLRRQNQQSLVRIQILIWELNSCVELFIQMI